MSNCLNRYRQIDPPPCIVEFSLYNEISALFGQYAFSFLTTDEDPKLLIIFHDMI